MDGNLIILAGGASSRMKGLTGSDTLTKDEKYQADNRSKCLISIDKNGRPLLDYLLYNAKKAGYKNIYIITSKENELFKMFYGDKRSDNDFKGLKINYAILNILINLYVTGKVETCRYNLVQGELHEKDHRANYCLCLCPVHSLLLLWRRYRGADGRLY